ncbi:MAG: hypothetical protein IK136_04855 [Oscillospiraceae bacterium]|nr:hypothetical protein [Oscillospiraceae bacterium]
MEFLRQQKQDLILQQSTIKDKLRSPAEVNARYVKGLAKYKELMRASEDHREQRIMLFNEIKALGWVLGKSDQTINNDLKI